MSSLPNAGPAAVLAEYTTIGILFKYFVGSVDYPIVIVVGVLTMFYTAYGGVYISIVTDQVGDDCRECVVCGWEGRGWAGAGPLLLPVW